MNLKPFPLILLATAMIIVLAGCGRGNEPVDTPTSYPKDHTGPAVTSTTEEGAYLSMNQDKQYIATLITNHGSIVIELFSNEAPTTVNNFVTLSQDGFYNNLIFHRVIPNFMIQGGDPTGTGRGGPGYAFEDEFHASRKFDEPGILAMANAGPNTNGSQFFITTAPTPHLTGRHTIFGRVLEGQDVVEAISTVATSAGDKPVEDVRIQEIRIEATPGE